MATKNPNTDPFADATAAGERKGLYWGKIEVEAEFVVLEKGRGKVAFDPDLHSADQRRTIMNFCLTPLDEMGLDRLIQREILAQSVEWSQIVWPSAKACGVTYAGDLNGMFVKVEMVKSGRKWVNNTGETVEATTFKLVKVFKSEAECKASFLAGDSADSGPQANGNGVAAKSNGNGNGNGAAAHNGKDNAERMTALSFLQVLVSQYGQDRAVLEQQIASTPLLNKYFTIASPEVEALLGIKVAA